MVVDFISRSLKMSSIAGFLVGRTKAAESRHGRKAIVPAILLPFANSGKTVSERVG
jgi:hypothetical protein